MRRNFPCLYLGRCHMGYYYGVRCRGCQNIITKKTGIISNKANILQTFMTVKKKYLNQETYINCRNTYLRKYTSEKFEINLLKILKS